MAKLTIEEKIEEELSNAVEQMMKNGKYVQKEISEKSTEEDKKESPVKPVKKSKAFAIFLSIYSAVLVIAICIGLFYVWNVLVDYEAGLADVNMERILADFGSDNIDGLLSGYEFNLSEFNDIGEITAIYKNAVSDNELSFAKDSGYKNDTPVYKVMAGEDVIARVTLLSTGKNGHGFPIWERGEVTFNDELIDYKSVSVKVPEGVKIFVNDREVSGTYKKSSEPVPITSHISEYVKNIPKYVIYNIDSLVGEPSITIDSQGINVVESPDENYTLSYTYAQDDSMYDAVADRAMAIAHSYAMYLIKKGDLSGVGSYTVGTAKKYLNSMGTNVFYLWNEEYTYDFSDEKVDNIVKYNDECLSCDVNFALNVHYRGGNTITYNTCIHGMYVNINGSWYLADFILDNTEEDT